MVSSRIPWIKRNIYVRKTTLVTIIVLALTSSFLFGTFLSFLTTGFFRKGKFRSFPVPMPVPTLPKSNKGLEEGIPREKLGFGYFKAEGEGVSYVVDAPQYELPLNLEEVSGYREITNCFPLNNKQKEFLSNNGFVGLRLNRFETLEKAYSFILENNLPLLITTDSVFHSYHVLFDETLKKVEINNLTHDLDTILLSLLQLSSEEVKKYKGSQLEPASTLLFQYIEVAYKLRNPNYPLSSAEAEKELELINNHSSISKSFVFGYKEDYTQYIPREHYTENEELKSYFKVMMWLGRMRFSLKNETHTKAAVLLCFLMKHDNLLGKWKRIYEITKFFVGYSDDLTFEDYFTVLTELNITSPEQLNQKETLKQLTSLLLKRNRSKILGTYGETYPWLPQQKELERILNKTAGLRFMGQRFTPDSYIFQKLVYPEVGTFTNPRLFPKALDLPSVLGSKVAEKALNKTENKFTGYLDKADKLRNEMAKLSPENWTKNLYLTWLYSLKTTLKDTRSKPYPTFMRTESWLFEKVQTFLGGWTEARHDTILYAKQSYTPKITAVPVPEHEKEKFKVFVEPYPETYFRLEMLVEMTMNGLKAFHVLSPDLEQSLTSFKSILNLLEKASIKELKGEELSSNEENQLVSSVYSLTEILKVSSEKVRKVTIVVDVHTDLNTKQVLEEALGKLNMVIVVFSNKNHKLYAAIGPIYNYFEFKQPINKRLTDKSWSNLVSKGGIKPLDWTVNFYSN